MYSVIVSLLSLVLYCFLMYTFEVLLVKYKSSKSTSILSNGKFRARCTLAAVIMLAPVPAQQGLPRGAKFLISHLLVLSLSSDFLGQT